MAKLKVGELVYTLRVDDSQYKRTMKSSEGAIDSFTKHTNTKVKDSGKQFGDSFKNNAKEVDTFVSKSKTGMDDFNTHSKKSSGMFSSSWGTAIKGVGAMLGGVVIAKGIQTLTSEVMKSIDAASALQEATSATEAVFGSSAEAMKEWATTASSSFLMSQGQALTAAKGFGVLFKSAGVAETQNAEMSKGLTQLAADLASFNDSSVDEAITALRAGMVGETEPLRRFGIQLSADAIKAEALASGLIQAEVNMTEVQKAQARLMTASERNTKVQADATATEAEKAKALAEVAAAEDAVSKALNGKVGELDQAAKTQAIYNLITKQAEATGQAGDIDRTADSFSNQRKQLDAQIQNLRETAGQAFIPVATSILQEINNVMPQVTAWFEENKDAIAQFFTDAFQGVKDNWPEIKDAMMTLLGILEKVADVSKVLWDAFQSLPPGLQQLIGLAAVAKFSGVGTAVKGGIGLARGAGAVIGGARGLGAAGGLGRAGAGLMGAARFAGPAAIALAGVGAINNLRHTEKVNSRADSLGSSRGGSQFLNVIDGATGGMFNLNKQLDDMEGQLSDSRAKFKEVQAEAQRLRDLGYNIPITVDPATSEETTSMFQEWIGGVGIIGSAIGDAISAGWGAITGFIGGVRSAIVSGLANAWQNAMGAVFGFISSAQSAFFGFVSGLASSIWNGISNGFMNALGAVANFASNLWTTIKNAIGNAIREGFQGLQTAAGNIPGVLFGGVKSIFGFADGGLVQGPGSGTSDSIPAMVSNGEYVLRKSAVDRIGIANLNAVNFGNAPKFATGGYVGSTSRGEYSPTNGLTIGQVTVVAQDTAKFEREMRVKARTASLAGRRG